MDKTKFFDQERKQLNKKLTRLLILKLERYPGRKTYREIQKLQKEVSVINKILYG